MRSKYENYLRQSLNKNRESMARYLAIAKRTTIPEIRSAALRRYFTLKQDIQEAEAILSEKPTRKV